MIERIIRRTLYFENLIFNLWFGITKSDRMRLQRVFIIAGLILMLVCDIIQLQISKDPDVRKGVLFLPLWILAGFYQIRSPKRVYAFLHPMQLRFIATMPFICAWLIPLDILYDALVVGRLQHGYVRLIGIALMCMGAITGFRGTVEEIRSRLT